MDCSQPKLSRTGLRNILAFLKVEPQHFLGGTRTLLRRRVARGLTTFQTSINTKIQPKFTWDGLSRLLVGASPKFIPGTNINVRFAKQLAQQERAEEKSRARDLRTEIEGRSANESIEAKPARQSRQRTNDTSHRDTCSQKQRGSYTISKN